MYIVSNSIERVSLKWKRKENSVFGRCISRDCAICIPRRQRWRSRFLFLLSLLNASFFFRARAKKIYERKINIIYTSIAVEIQLAFYARCVSVSYYWGACDSLIGINIIITALLPRIRRAPRGRASFIIYIERGTAAYSNDLKSRLVLDVKNYASTCSLDLATGLCISIKARIALLTHQRVYVYALDGDFCIKSTTRDLFTISHVQMRESIYIISSMKNRRRKQRKATTTTPSFRNPASHIHIRKTIRPEKLNLSRLFRPSISLYSRVSK